MPKARSNKTFCARTIEDVTDKTSASTNESSRNLVFATWNPALPIFCNTLLTRPRHGPTCQISSKPAEHFSIHLTYRSKLWTNIFRRQKKQKNRGLTRSARKLSRRFANKTFENWQQFRILVSTSLVETKRCVESPLCWY